MANLSETEFADLIDALASDPSRHHELEDLLREEHPAYEQRGAATVVRMRGWILLALARIGVSDHNLLFILEELDNGIDPYLVASAARALRSYRSRRAAFAPPLMRAIARLRYRDEPLSLAEYGAYAVSGESTGAVCELLRTLAWLGPHAHQVLPELEALRAERISQSLKSELENTFQAIKEDERTPDQPADDCCALPENLASKFSWLRGSRRSSDSIEAAVFEDQDGVSIGFDEFFRGRPTIVVFFYTRCDNPLKCSLTITKLSRIQKLLAERGLADKIKTAAITYDPAFDLPKRLRVYGEDRGVRIDEDNRLLRATKGFAAVREHFQLGVNFIESLVNRHRVEAYVLDADGRISASFERLLWDESEVVDRAAAALMEQEVVRTAPVQVPRIKRKVAHASTPVLGTLASLAVAFFPKCPICWAAYLSMFGIAGLNQIPYLPWLQPILIAVMLINLGSVWLRGWLTGRVLSSFLVSAGAVLVLASKMWPAWEKAVMFGVGLTFAGSILSAFGAIKKRKELASS